MTDSHTLPLGVFAPPGGGHPRIGMRLDDVVVDMAPLAALTDSPFTDVLAGETLNPLLAASRPVWESLRDQCLDWLESGATEQWQIPLDRVELLLPFTVGDYVDFYASEHHAVTVGELFRPGQPPLPKAWRQLPQGYHGRSGTVVVSGTPLRRPRGLHAAVDASIPEYGPTQRLDVEVEVGFVIGTPSELGKPLQPKDFRDHVFGLVVLNDWSARDIQSFESVPLGPHTGKSFGTSISPWVIPLAGLDHLVVDVPSNRTELASYLAETEPAGLDLDLALVINGETVARQPYSSMYWSPAQLLAQLTVTGASVRTGDLFASGTVSGPTPEQAGSLLELWRGTKFLADGDTVEIRADARHPNGVDRLDLGTVEGTVLPALP